MFPIDNLNPDFAKMLAQRHASVLRLGKP